MKDRRVHLKIKIKSLTEEMRMIRKEESKLKKRGKKSSQLYWSLRGHREDDIRPLKRPAHLAYAFLKGRPYSSVESKVHPGNEPNFTRVKKEIDRCGVCENQEQYSSIEGWRARRDAMVFDVQERNKAQDELWEKWLKEAKEHLKK